MSSTDKYRWNENRTKEDKMGKEKKQTESRKDNAKRIYVWRLMRYYAPSSIFRDPPLLSTNQSKVFLRLLEYILILYDNLLQSCECIKTKKRIMKISWYISQADGI